MWHDRNDLIYIELAKWERVDSEFRIWRVRFKDVEQSHRDLGLLGTDRSNHLLLAIEEEVEPICARRNEVLEKLYSTKPATLEGLAAFVQVFISEDLVEAQGLAGIAMMTICDAILSLVEIPR